MGKSLLKPGGKAGTARLCGNSGLVFRIEGRVCYLPPHEMHSMCARGSAPVVSGDGDRVGKAWLSPLLYPEKQDLTLHVGNRLFSVSWPDVERIISRKRMEAPLYSLGVPCRTGPEGY
jgi:hypothetical protein